jgi:hypothetical protein
MFAVDELLDTPDAPNQDLSDSHEPTMDDVVRRFRELCSRNTSSSALRRLTRATSEAFQEQLA